MGDETISGLGAETVAEKVLGAIQEEESGVVLEDARECESFSGMGVQCYFVAPQFIPVRPVIDMAERNECIEIETMSAKSHGQGAQLCVFFSYFDTRESQTFVPEEEMK